MKRCIKCNIEKPLDLFQTRNHKTGLKRTECKECIYKLHRVYYEENKDVILKKNKQYYFKNWDIKQKQRNDWLKNHPVQYKIYKNRARKKYLLNFENVLKNRARSAVRYAVIKGYIIKPLYCEQCNAKNVIIEGHHYKGYAIENRLLVMWLCQKCHKIEEKKLC